MDSGESYFRKLLRQPSRCHQHKSATIENICDATTFSPPRSDYPPITSVEQRRKYKTEFDKDYAEYRQLHVFMDKARRKFAILQEELSTANPSEMKYQVRY